MNAPLVVNTKDGTVWTRRGALRGGEPLYAPQAICQCPEFVMATLAELAEHGIAGSAYALPMPVGPKPLVLTEQQIDALAAAGNRIVNDAVHQDLCMCDAWPEKCLSTGAYFMGAWDVSGLETALPAVLGLWESMRGGELVALRARVAELEAVPRERPVDEAPIAYELTEKAEELTVFRASHESIVFGLYTTREAAREHCKKLMERENSALTLDWRPDGPWREGDDGEPGPYEAEELYEYGTHESSTWNPTGYVVTPLEVASEYDEQADE